MHLSEEERVELHRQAHALGVMPRTRDRLERVWLSDAGWSIPRIAPHWRLSGKRVLHWIKAYLRGGFEALPDRAHVGQASILTPEKVAALRAEIGKGERAWTAGQVAVWLAEAPGVRLGVDWLRRLLRRVKVSYQRTSRRVTHKQKAEKVEVKVADLERLKKGHKTD
ncbi:MAG: winged helix-turn-helix domain-containing protein [Armatimonadetes bacterium]|nr:winged helix-turn-helix domain-containing protein [Armatimonadota bacterium]